MKNSSPKSTSLSRFIRILSLLALPLAVYSSGSAASLHGKVSDVFDGESIAILSQTHTLKVKLIGVAPPEKTQAYADIARQHLADLILNKFVVVKYSAMREGHLVGQVLLGEMDVCAQMIRDGVAWYKPAEGDLSPVERQIYQASQEAARSERRGLWQDESPLAPWEFRKAQAAKLSTPTTRVAPQPRQSSLPRRGTQAGLSREDLIGGLLLPGSIAGKPEVRSLASDASPVHWLKYQPADKHFSVLFPSNGREITYPVLDGQGKTMNLHYLIGKTNSNFYLVLWGAGPNGSATDTSATDDTIDGLLRGMNEATARTSGLVVTAAPGRSLKVDSYAGRQFALTAGPISGVVRVLTKQTGEEREVFLLCVLNAPDAEESGDAFLNSLKIFSKR